MKIKNEYAFELAQQASREAVKTKSHSDWRLAMMFLEIAYGL